ncbi:MAG: hypothetical protein PHX43_08590 [Alphaproteobacteria bacterium]|nr:hypothetical protein [Alphaproteobacteria bacterium]
MIKKKQIRFAILTAAIIAVGMLPSSAQAYMGPGAGLSAIGSVIALGSTVLISIVGIIWYPIKKLIDLKFRKDKDD